MVNADDIKQAQSDLDELKATYGEMGGNFTCVVLTYSTSTEDVGNLIDSHYPQLVLKLSNEEDQSKLITFFREQLECVHEPYVTEEQNKPVDKKALKA